MLAIDEVTLDVVPATEGLLQGVLVVEVLVEVEPAHDVLGLHPPVEVVVHMARVEVGLVNHRAVGIEPLLGGFRHFTHDGFHLFQHRLVAQHERCLVHEPRALDVVAVTLQMTGAARPVVLEEEVEVVGVGIEDAVGEDADEVTERQLYMINHFLRHRDSYWKHGTKGRYVIAIE